jgi:hypothetical protein
MKCNSSKGIPIRLHLREASVSLIRNLGQLRHIGGSLPTEPDIDQPYPNYASVEKVVSSYKELKIGMESSVRIYLVSHDLHAGKTIVVQE